MGLGGVGWDDNVHVLVHAPTGTATSSSFLLSCRHRHCSFMISYRRGGVGWVWVGWGGVGWDNNVHVSVHTQARQPHNLSCLLSCRHRHSCFPISYWWRRVGWGGVGWGGVRWDNNVHVPVHTQAREPHRLSCCPADTGTALF